MYDSEVWTLSKSDENTLEIWEMKILRKIYGPVTESGVWRIRTNQELMDLCTEPEVISEIRKGRLRWLGHVERVPEERTVTEVFKNAPEEKRSVGKPRKSWFDDVENDLKKTGVRGWRKIARDRDAWKLILKETRVLHGS
jgi:hypothetical protein